MRANQRPSSLAQRILPVDERRFEFLEPTTSPANALDMTNSPTTFYLTRPALVSLKREANAASASDWRNYAQRKLDDALAQYALPLPPAQTEALQRYADTFDLEPQQLLPILLAPGVARRERLLRQSLAFVRAHAPRRPSGCLMLAVWVAALVGVWNLAMWALSLTPLLLHH